MATRKQVKKSKPRSVPKRKTMKADEHVIPPYPDEPCVEGAIVLYVLRCVQGAWEPGWLESSELSSEDHGHLLGAKIPCLPCVKAKKKSKPKPKSKPKKKK